MSNNAGDVIDEAAGTQYRIVGAGLYLRVYFENTIVCLQQFVVEDTAELDLEGELAVIA